MFKIIFFPEKKNKKNMCVYAHIFFFLYLKFSDPLPETHLFFLFEEESDCGVVVLVHLPLQSCPCTFTTSVMSLYIYHFSPWLDFSVTSLYIYHFSPWLDFSVTSLYIYHFSPWLDFSVTSLYIYHFSPWLDFSVTSLYIYHFSPWLDFSVTSLYIYHFSPWLDFSVTSLYIFLFGLIKKYKFQNPIYVIQLIGNRFFFLRCDSLTPL